MTFAPDAWTTLLTQILLLRCSLRATLTAWQTIAAAKWSRDATAARKNAINCRKASSNSRDETLSRWIMLKRLKSGINKQSAEGRREESRAKTSIQNDALEQQRGSSLRMVEQPSEGGGRIGREGVGGEGAGEMDESCWGLKGASERVNLK